ncbi:MAG TPA: hypothetical protein VI816_03890, partial [Candidatus Bathyarchaeia archaeon]|nr:hypothetical protein [Candidatus Bathyarchaeia archaeon]
ERISLRRASGGIGTQEVWPSLIDPTERQLTAEELRRVVLPRNFPRPDKSRIPYLSFLSSDTP